MKRLWLELAVIFLLSATPLLWFREGKLINGADINFPLDPAARLVSRLHLYDPTIGGGLDMSGSAGSIIFHGFQALLQQLGLGLVAIEQVQFVFWFLVTGLAFYLFAKSFEKYLPVSPLVGVLFWQFNPYRIATWTESNVATLAGLTLLPAAIGLINFVVQRKISERVALIALAGVTVLSAGLGLNPPVIVVVGFAIGLYLILAIRRLGLPVRFAVTSVLTMLGISAFWLYPTIASLLASSGKLSATDLNLLDWVQGLSKNTSLWNVMRLQGAWDWYEGWQGEPYITYAHSYRKPILVLLSLVPASLVIGGLAATIRHKKTRVFAWFSLILMVIGLALGMGTHQPMRGIFTFLKDHLPLFWIFRSPWYKFTLLTVTGYGLMIAVGAGTLEHVIKAKAARYLVTFLIAISFIGFSFPLVTGALFPTQKERKQLNAFHVTIPNYVYEMASFLNQLPDKAGVIMLPEETAFNYTWGYGSAGDITNHIINRPIFFSQNFTPTGQRNDAELAKLFYRHLYAKDPRTTQFLRLANVRYLLHKRDSNKSIYNDVDNTQFIQERLALLPDVEFVKNFGMWDLWQLRDAPSPAVGATSDPLVFYGNPLSYLTLIENRPELKDKSVVFSPPAKLAGTLGGFTRYLPIDLTASRVVNDQIETNLTVPSAGNYGLYAIAPKRTIELTIGDRRFTVKPASGRETHWNLVGNLDLSQGTTTVTLTGPQRPFNLIDDPAFGSSLSLTDPFKQRWQFVDASEDAPGKPSYDSKQTQAGIELSSTNHILGLKQHIENIDPAGLYLLSFDYQYIGGSAPEFGFWQTEANYGAPSGELSKSGALEHYETVFTPDPRTRSADLYFYARPKESGPTTSFRVTNVRLLRLSGQVEAFFLVAGDPNHSEPAIPVTVRSETATGLSFRVGATDKKIIVHAPVAHGSGWELSAKDAKPIETNFFGSGFILDAGPERTLSLNYTPKKRLLIGGSISLLTVLAILWPLRRKKR
ncbi:MAG: alpha-(1-_3)-arabinofuranosyltransferase family protein [Patescibacteria group bacterium]